MNTPNAISTLRNLVSGLPGTDDEPRKIRRPGAVSRGRLEAGASAEGGAFKFRVHVLPGTDYLVETSVDLVMWSPIAEGVAMEAVTEFVDTQARNQPHQFYRAITGLMSSVNVIGFVRLTLGPGLSMLSNPFYSPTSDIGALLAVLPDGMVLHKYDSLSQRLVKHVFSRGRWTDPQATLSPGEGCVIENPNGSPAEAIFMGEICQGNLCNPIPAGSSIRSSMVPQAGVLDADLGFPAAEGDTVNLLDAESQRYAAHRFENGTWSPAPPRLDIAGAFWIQKRTGASWRRNFLMN